MQSMFFKQLENFEHYNICKKVPQACISSSPTVSACCFFPLSITFSPVFWSEGRSIHNMVRRTRAMQPDIKAPDEFSVLNCELIWPFQAKPECFHLSDLELVGASARPPL